MCDNNWNLDDATVVCQQLGYSGAWTAYYQPGEGLVKVEEPQCTGEETTLLDCWTAQSIGGNAFCSHGRDVAVDCMTSIPYGMAHACTKQCNAGILYTFIQTNDDDISASMFC